MSDNSPSPSSELQPERGSSFRQALMWVAVIAVLMAFYGYRRGWNAQQWVDVGEGWLAFLATVGVLVFFHELGHFLAARAVGVAVPEFAIGFGPRLWTYMRRGDTDYTIRVLPLGGFVNLKGMNPEEAEAGASDSDALYSKSAAARGLVFFAGPLANIILAVVVLCSSGAILGEPQERVMVGIVTPGSPAQRMGLVPGDRILQVQDTAVTSRGMLIETISNSGGAPVTLTVRRDGAQLVLTGQPELRQAHPSEEPRPLLGFVPEAQFQAGPRQTIGASIRAGLDDMQLVGYALLNMFAKPKDLGENVGGPIAIFQQTKSQAEQGPLAHLRFMAFLSISLAVFNLMPIPMLDGGHLLLLGVEVLRRRRLEPGTQTAVHFAGMIFLVILLVMILFNDVQRMVQRPGPATPPPSNAPVNAPAEAPAAP